jgi:hypothetical protein
MRLIAVGDISEGHEGPREASERTPET